MNFIITAVTDAGIEKKVNQDSMLVKNMSLGEKKFVMAVLCDGMGGLSMGEVASASVVNIFNRWIHTKLADLIQNGVDQEALRSQWEGLIAEIHEKIMEYGRQHQVKLGSTLVAMLLTGDKYYILNVGDSRAYEIGKKLTLLTEDHTLVAKEVSQGILSAQDARKDRRRHILLQCIGASSVVYPAMYIGDTRKDTVYMLCSDGFRHELSENEILESLSVSDMTDVEKMRERAEELIAVNKERKERDNISVLLIRTY